MTQCRSIYGLLLINDGFAAYINRYEYFRRQFEDLVSEPDLGYADAFALTEVLVRSLDAQIGIIAVLGTLRASCEEIGPREEISIPMKITHNVVKDRV